MTSRFIHPSIHPSIHRSIIQLRSLGALLWALAAAWLWTMLLARHAVTLGVSLVAVSARPLEDVGATYVQQLQRQQQQQQQKELENNPSVITITALIALLFGWTVPSIDRSAPLASMALNSTSTAPDTFISALGGY